MHDPIGPAEHERRAAIWETVLIRSNRVADLARNLGFEHHTAIHEAVKPILAKHIAGILASVADPGRGAAADTHEGRPGPLTDGE